MALEGQGSVKAFARRVGISGTMLQSYLRGESDPSRQRLIDIAVLAGVSVEWLATGNGPMRPGSVSPGPVALEDAPVERFVAWIRDWWKAADKRQRTWMEIELERRFPEFVEAEKKQQEKSASKFLG